MRETVDEFIDLKIKFELKGDDGYGVVASAVGSQFSCQTPSR